MTIQDEGHSQHFSKRIRFSTWWLSQLWKCSFKQMCCAKC